MKAVHFALTGALAGLLAGWILGSQHRSEPLGSGSKLPVIRQASFPIPAPKPAPDEFARLRAAPAGLRNAIRLEQSILRLSRGEALRLLPSFNRKTNAFAALLLGWRAAETDPHAALDVAVTVNPMSGILRRWLMTDASGALGSCANNEARREIVFQQYAEIDPAACAAAMLSLHNNSSFQHLVDAWAAREPLQARAWVETHYPKSVSEFYRAWMLGNAPGAIADFAGLPWGGKMWVPPNDWLANAFSTLRGANPEFAADTFKTFNPAQLLEPASPVNFMLSGIADVDIELALHLADTLEPPELRDTALSECALTSRALWIWRAAFKRRVCEPGRWRISRTNWARPTRSPPIRSLRNCRPSSSKPW